MLATARELAILLVVLLDLCVLTYGQGHRFLRDRVAG
jgi:hypothetical protein